MAVPGRYGRGGGMRSSVGVVAVTLLLVVGAVAAAYAALSSDANRAVKPPVVAQVPPAAVAPPTSAVPPAAIKPPVAAAKPPALPKLPKATVTPKAAAAVPPAKPKSVAHPKPTPTAPAKPAKPAKRIVLDTDAAGTYNPYGFPTASFSDPANAIDGDVTTSWTYKLDPARTGPVAVGLTIDMKAPQAVARLRLRTPSQGMRVEIYGANDQLPVSLSDPGWTHLATRNSLHNGKPLTLKAHRKSFRFLLIWITKAPQGQTTGEVGISEVAVERA